QQPAQDLAPLLLVAWAEAPEPLGEVVEDHAGLAQGALAVDQDRHLAHRIELAVGGRARLAVEEVDEARRPVGAAERQHQRRLVGIARLGEAVQGVLGHGGLPRNDASNDSKPRGTSQGVRATGRRARRCGRAARQRAASEAIAENVPNATAVETRITAATRSASAPPRSAKRKALPAAGSAAISISTMACASSSRSTQVATPQASAGCTTSLTSVSAQVSSPMRAPPGR